MPSERNPTPTVDRPLPESLPVTNKVCAHCQLPLDPPPSTTASFLHPDPIVCGGCRDKAQLLLSADAHALCLERDTRQPDGLSVRSTRTVPDERILEQDMDIDPDSSLHPSLHPSDAAYRPPPSLSLDVSHLSSTSRHSSPPTSLPHQARTHAQVDHDPRTGHRPSSSPDPLTDITRLRVRIQSRCCLYSGATFQGTQKSGRNSYEVQVTIVDVDLLASSLCGYLRIRGLTDDWPELTTYFDAEIIGSRYGFLTQNWGATEQEDMVHWSRFPAFRHVKNELKKPLLTVDDRDRGAVFMRWKERFLVPDHRVQDISGASFAGFYYVCVDFNPSPVAVHPAAAEKMEVDVPAATVPLSKAETPTPPRRDSSVRPGRPSPSPGVRGSTPVATMNGFYFHQNSEPYQQLSLTHIPESTSSVFEFR